MCTKLYLDWNDPGIKKITDTARRTVLLDRFHAKMAVRLQDSGEAVPKHLLATFAPDKNGNRQIYLMRWGFNIDDELREKYTVHLENIENDVRYKDDYRSHRCIIPVTYFIEQEHKRRNDGSVTIGKEYIVQPSGLDHSWLCGIYKIENGFPYCVLLTRPAIGEYKENMHDRIPLILPDSLTDK